MSRKFKYSLWSLVIILILAASAYIYTNNQDDVEHVDQVAFSPSKECEDIIVNLINESKEKIDVAVYAINNDNIVKALKSADKKGIKIRILTDKLQARQKSSKVLDLYQSGLNIRVHSKYKIEHNKFAIFDDKYVITGSYNWTNPASKKNSENCLLSVENEDIIADYQSRFDYLWRINTKKKSDAWFLNKLNTKEYYARGFITNKQQKKIKRTLEDAIDTFDAKGGSVIIMNADNGQIISQTSINTDKNIMEYSQNFIYSGGSVIKPFVIALALENKIINTDSVFEVFDTISSENQKLSLDDVLVKSSNAAIMQIAEKLSTNGLHSFFEKLGFSKPIQNQSIKTTKPLFAPSFNKDQALQAAIGTNFRVTPMHLIAAYASLINGGHYYEPYAEKQSSNEGKYIISENNSEIMNELLRKVVQKGTAKQADKLSKVKLNAITGTNVKDAKNKNIVVTTLIGNFNCKRKSYVILVMLDEPKPIEETHGFVSAGWNVAPLAAQIINIVAKKS